MKGQWPVRVFAVDDSSAQLTWPASPAEGLHLEVGDAVAEPEVTVKVPLVLDRAGAALYRQGTGPGGEQPVRAPRFRNGWRDLDPAWPGGPGAVTVEGLRPDQEYEVVARAKGTPAFVAGRLRTLAPPPGRELCRFATVSDVHIGERHFGVWGRLYDLQYTAAGEAAGEDQALFYPFRALRAAMAEADAWGARLLVAKGDLSRRTLPAEMREAGRLLASSPVPVEALMGNHDNVGGVNARGVLAAQGVRVSYRPRAVDMEGLRLVLIDSNHGRPGTHMGWLSPEVTAEAAGLVAGAERAAWVGLHHPLETHPYPLAYPPGVPYAQGRALVRALAATGKPVFLSAGHRHRNRRYRWGPVDISEVGSTKDYPGGWAAYKVYEGGITQMVRRTERPDVITWTENTRRAMNGQWGRWSPGRLEDRCFSLAWP